MSACPCCGYVGQNVELERVPEMAGLTPMETVLFRRLVKDFGRNVSKERLLTALYSGTNGGPEWSLSVLNVIASRLKKKIAAFDLIILSGPGKPHRRLVWSNFSERN